MSEANGNEKQINAATEPKYNGPMCPYCNRRLQIAIKEYPPDLKNRNAPTLLVAYCMYLNCRKAVPMYALPPERRIIEVDDPKVIL